MRLMNWERRGGYSNRYRRRPSDPAQVPYNPCAARVCGVLRRSPQHPETTLNDPDLPPKSRTGPGWSGSPTNWSTHTAGRYRPCRYAYPRRRPRALDGVARRGADTPCAERGVGWRRHPAARAQWHVGRLAPSARPPWRLGGREPAAGPQRELGRWRAAAAGTRRELGWWSAAPRTRRQLAWPPTDRRLVPSAVTARPSVAATRPPSLPAPPRHSPSSAAHSAPLRPPAAGTPATTNAKWS